MTDGTQPTTDTAARLAELQSRQALLETRAAISDLRWDRLTQPLTGPLELLRQLFPQGQPAPPADTITTTGDEWGYAPGISLAYEVIEEELVDKLIAQLKEDLVAEMSKAGKQKANVLIVDSLQYAPDDLPLAEVTGSFKSFKASLGQQSDNIDDVKNSLTTYKGSQAGAGQPEVLPALVTAPLLLGAAVPSIISTVAGIAANFQTTYSVTGPKFDLASEGLLAAVAGQLRKSVENVNVFISNFYAMGESALLNSFMEVQGQALDLKTKRDELGNQIAKPLNDQVAVLSQQIRTLESQRNTLDSGAKGPQTADIERRISELQEKLRPIQHDADLANATVQASDALLTEYATFKTAITTSADGKPTKLAQAMLRNRVYETGITHILFVKVIFSGGQAITKEKWGSDQLGYMGETGLSFVLAKREDGDDDGAVVSSGLLRGMRSRTVKPL